MISNIITVLLVLGVLGFFTYRRYKKLKSELEKFLYIFICIVCIIPSIIYYIDRYNIPSTLGWSDNINTQNWLSFLGNYSSGVISALIGSVVLLLVTIMQINKNNEDNMKRDAENTRLQNMPMLKYDIDTNNVDDDINNINDFIDTKFENTHSYSLNITLKNIGLNNIKNMKIDLDSDIINERLRIIGTNTQVLLEKGEILNVKKFFSLNDSRDNYELKFSVYYEDVLNNWYKQILLINYEATNIFNIYGYLGEANYVVKEEEKINYEDIPM